MTTLQHLQQQAGPSPTKLVAMVVRVSTDRQARNDEGSLKNQVQRLRQHIQYKSEVCGEAWTEASVYELKGISGKNSMRSREFERLFSDIRAGLVNTILCTALDRICRSVKDFLWFFEFLNEHGAEFVCLKQNYDTTSPQGKLFVTIMMALAEFEREQTSERTRDAMAARSERGLWNGGRLLGYNADPVNKGTLVPNPDEVAIVNFLFEKYLECGSIVETTEALNRRGYRTKNYTSRRQVHHPGSEFHSSTVQSLLKNPALIGKKALKKQPVEKGGNGYRLVDAVWPPIVDREKFEAAQKLMVENGRTHRNAAEPVRHAYVLSRGILHCGRCGTVMDGRCGTGRQGVRYYYYVCTNKECGLRVAAGEIEGAVLDRIRALTTDGNLLDRLTAETKARLLRQKPSLEKQRQTLQKGLADVKAKADKLLNDWTEGGDSAGQGFVVDKLNSLAQQKTDLEAGLATLEESLKQVQEQAVTTDKVKQVLSRMSEVYGRLKPFEKRELMGLVLKRAEVNERQIVLEIRALVEEHKEALETVSCGKKVRATINWLPEQDSNL